MIFEKVIVIGLGYVGLPLAVTLARSLAVVGFDIDEIRIAELRESHDRTGEVDGEAITSSMLSVTSDPEDCRDGTMYIITVPTPVDADNQPDLTMLLAATRTVAQLLNRDCRPVVVYESTVYPGLTEEICVPLIEAESGLQYGRDFFVGYSPERINPGDRTHRVDNIVKVVAGDCPETLDRLVAVYSKVTAAGVFPAASIKAAEAAKVIENAQRDINIAFMNEITQIFAKLDLSIWDVLEAAKTKWNFVPFEPGLVGGHCIGIDPYYLSFRAIQLNHLPKVILAGRGINDGMGKWVADRLHDHRGKAAGSALVLGLTFKENVPDLRNSRVVDVILRLHELGHEVTVHDPFADPAEARREYGIELAEDALDRTYDLVFAAVPHQPYATMTVEKVRSLLNEGASVADLKGIWRGIELGPDVASWSL